MAFVTQVPSSFIGLNVDTPVLATGQIGVLNDFQNGQPVTGDIGATNEGPGGAIVADPGEAITVPVDGGSVSGVYVGPATLSSVSTTVGIPQLANLNITLNPINGQLFQGDDGNAYLITDDPIDDGRLGATLTTTILGQNFTVTAPVSDLLGGLTTQINAAGQTAYNTAYNTAYTTTFNAGFLLPPAARIAAAQAAGTAAGEAARLPFTAAATTIGASEGLVQGTLDTIVFTLTPGTGFLDVVCFGAGTLILTAHGPVDVADLSVGDRVMTRDRGLQPIRWIGTARLSQAELAANPHLHPIRIRAGALGPSTPDADLIVSPQHRILVRSAIAQRMFGTMEILVAAKQLLQVEGVDIAYDLQTVDYVHFLLDRHEVVTANGTESESLFTGPQALKSVGAAAQAEILALFPHLLDADYEAIPAVAIASGRLGRKLALRHVRNARPLVA